jgi:hypothetical protein
MPLKTADATDWFVFSEVSAAPGLVSGSLRKLNGIFHAFPHPSNKTQPKKQDVHRRRAQQLLPMLVSGPGAGGKPRLKKH